MKIVFTIRAINTCGGTERATLTIANALVERGYDVSIVSFLGEEESPFFKIHEKIQVYYLAPTKDRHIALVRDIRRIVLLRKLYKSIQPDLIVLSGALRSIVNIPAVRGYKVVSWDHFSTNYHRSHPISRLSRRLSAHHSVCVVALTPFDAEVYQQEYGAKKAVVIPNALTLPKLSPSTLQNKTILSVGRLTPIKGYDLLLQMWNSIAHDGWKLRIIGAGKSTSLEEQIQREGIQDVEILSPTANIGAEYQQASLYVMSSRSEGFPLVLPEAMSVGLPVVSFDCGAGVREIIKDGETGIIVPPLNVDELGKAVSNLMRDEDKCKAMSRAALERVKLYEIPNIVSIWEQLITDLLQP